jgi:hypothetical protein
MRYRGKLAPTSSLSTRQRLGYNSHETLLITHTLFALVYNSIKSFPTTLEMPLPSSESGIHRLPISLVEILTPHVRGCNWGLLPLLLASTLASLQPPRFNFGATFCCHVRPAFDTRHEIAAGDLLANLKVDPGFITVVC